MRAYYCWDIVRLRSWRWHENIQLSLLLLGVSRLNVCACEARLVSPSRTLVYTFVTKELRSLISPLSFPSCPNPDGLMGSVHCKFEDHPAPRKGGGDPLGPCSGGGGSAISDSAGVVGTGLTSAGPSARSGNSSASCIGSSSSSGCAAACTTSASWSTLCPSTASVGCSRSAASSRSGLPDAAGAGKAIGWDNSRVILCLTPSLSCQGVPFMAAISSELICASLGSRLAAQRLHLTLCQAHCCRPCPAFQATLLWSIGVGSYLWGSAPCQALFLPTWLQDGCSHLLWPA